MATTTSEQPMTATPLPPQIFELANGDRLTREEFHRRYEAMPHVKLESYRRNGVREYIVWRVEDGAIEWFLLHAGQFKPLPPSTDGVLKSEVLPGLWLDPRALLEGNSLRVLEVVQRGVQSPEHAAFVQQLAARHVDNPS